MMWVQTDGNADMNLNVSARSGRFHLCPTPSTLLRLYNCRMRRRIMDQQINGYTKGIYIQLGARTLHSFRSESIALSDLYFLINNQKRSVASTVQFA